MAYLEQFRWGSIPLSRSVELYVGQHVLVVSGSNDDSSVYRFRYVVGTENGGLRIQETGEIPNDWDPSRQTFQKWALAQAQANDEQISDVPKVIRTHEGVGCIPAVLGVRKVIYEGNSHS